MVAAFALLFTTAGLFLAIPLQGEQTTTDSWCLNPPPAVLENCQGAYTVYHRTNPGLAYFGEIEFLMLFAGIIAVLSVVAVLVVIYADAVISAFRRRKKANSQACMSD
jgi:hypothetical protein